MVAAFYLTNQPRATKLDRFIGWITRGNCSHVELCTEDGYCFSISPRENEARWKKINIHSGRWKLVPVDITEEEAWDKAMEWRGHKYDYVGAATSPLPIHIQLASRVFCSEVIGWILGIEKPYRYSPRALFLHLSGLPTGWERVKQWAYQLLRSNDGLVETERADTPDVVGQDKI